MKKLILTMAVLLALTLGAFAADDEYVPVISGKTFYSDGWSCEFIPRTVLDPQEKPAIEQGWAIVQYGDFDQVAEYSYYQPVLFLGEFKFVYANGYLFLIQSPYFFMEE
jgi:hypothetical protein